jgi:hypothetical protein
MTNQDIKTTMTPFEAVMIAESGDDQYSEDQIIEAWQYLHTSGLAYQLQGWFGRTAQSLITQGVINA